MNKEFVEYNEALALKELGFNEPCFYKFHKGGFQINSLSDGQNYNDGSFGVNLISAPLYQQAFRWFREKYNLYQFVHYHNRPEYTFAVYNDIEINWTLHEKVSFNTYEEAELECLKKLIEIVKNGK
jgi:hypothetical protein